MPIPDMTGLPPFAEFQDIVNKVNVFVQQYNNLMLSLDSLNVVSLTADHIDAGTINANIVTIRGDYESGAFIELSATGIRINDGTQDTFVIDTEGNAFFTGRITASVIIGSEIKTAESTYPRVELSSSGNIFAAYKSATDYIAIDPDATGSPTLIFDNGTTEILLSAISSTYSLLAITGNISINSQNGDITLSSGTGKYTKIAGWTKFLNTNTGQTLQQDLDSKQAAITGGDITVVGGVAILGNNINTTHLANGSVSNTEFQYLDGVTSAIQTQFSGKASKTQQAWQTPTLLNSWVNFGGANTTAQYMKDEMGFVHLKGMIKTGTIGTVAFTLPAGYLPSSEGTSRFPAVSNDAFGQLGITTGGNVTPLVGSSTWFALNGITFLAEN